MRSSGQAIAMMIAWLVIQDEFAPMGSPKSWRAAVTVVLDPARYPTAVRAGSAAGAEYGAAHNPARSFMFGLQRIIDGIDAFINTASP